MRAVNVTDTRKVSWLRDPLGRFTYLLYFPKKVELNEDAVIRLVD